MKPRWILALLLAGCAARPIVGLPGSEDSATWMLQFGGSLSTEGDLILTADGGFLHARTTQIFDVGPQGILLTKLDASGERDWQRVYGGHAQDSVNGLVEFDDGSIAVIGTTESFEAQKKDGWVLRVDRDGDLLWQQSYGAEGDDVLMAGTVVSDGGLMLVGYSDSQGFGSSLDAWVLRLSGDGEMKFSKLYGDWNWERALSIVGLPQDRFVIAGESRTLAAPAHDLDGWVFEIDLDGKIHWQETIGGMSDDSFQSVAVSQRGGYVLAGYTQSYGVLGDDIWLVEIDAFGQIAWQRAYGTVHRDRAFAVIPANTAGYLLAGEIDYGDHTEALILKIKSFGQIGWQKRIVGEGNTHLNAVRQTHERNVILGGTGESQMVKLNPYGFLHGECAAFQDAEMEVDYPSSAPVLAQARSKDLWIKSQATASKDAKVKTWTGALCPRHYPEESAP